MNDESPVFATLEELFDRPELLRAPECVVPRFAYRGRTVVLAAPDKSGKSTLAAYAIVALSWGREFLGEPVSTRHGRAVLVGVEEAVADEVRRLFDLKACPPRVQVLTRVPGAELLDQMRGLLDEWSADLLVVDSLSEYARAMQGVVPDDGDTAGWAAAIRPLVQLSRDYDTAVLILHHVRRSDGQYRGSGEIAAAADAIIEMSVARNGENSTLRRLRGRGRWAVEPFTFTLGDHGPELGPGSELSVDARALLHIQQTRGISTRSLRERLGVRNTEVSAALDRLKDRGVIENHGSATAHEWHPVQAQAEHEVEL